MEMALGLHWGEITGCPNLHPAKAGGAGHEPRGLSRALGDSGSICCPYNIPGRSLGSTPCCVRPTLSPGRARPGNPRGFVVLPALLDCRTQERFCSWPGLCGPARLEQVCAFFGSVDESGQLRTVEIALGARPTRALVPPRRQGLFRPPPAVADPRQRRGARGKSDHLAAGTLSLAGEPPHEHSRCSPTHRTPESALKGPV